MGQVTSLTLFGALNAASQGLLASRSALQVTGQNVANVDTLGYSRQRPVIQSLPLFSGATLSSIERLRNLYLDQQRTGAVASQGYASQRSQALAQLENIFDESRAPGAMALLDQFFGAIHDLTLNPAGAAEREAMRSAGYSLQNQIGSSRRRLQDLQASCDSQIRGMLGKINQLAGAIAELNRSISINENAGLGANELYDQRVELTRQLAQLIPIQTLTSEDGVFSISVPSGLNLVSGDSASSLTAISNADNGGMANIGLTINNGPTVDITQWLTQGELGGLIANRDGDIKTSINQLDLFAAQLATAFNVQHRQGWTQGAVPVQNVDFFTVAPVYAHANAANTGGATVTAATVANQSQLTFHDYEIRFGAGGTYQVYDVTAGTSTGPFVYASGAAIAFDGMSVTIANGGAGPAAGDVFKVNSYSTAAQSLDLSAAIKANIGNIAASSDGAAGDNANALALAGLRERAILAGGSQTFSEYLGANQAALGVATQRANQDLDARSLAVEQVNGFIEQVSGVSIDEESTFMIQYQRAFQANSRVISAVDEMLQSLINMI